MRAQITELCTVANSLEGIEFRGLMGYDGGAVPTAQDSADRLHAARDAVEATGLTVGLISGAGSENYVRFFPGPFAHRGCRLANQHHHQWVASVLDDGGTTWEMQGGGGVLCCQKYCEPRHACLDL